MELNEVLRTTFKLQAFRMGQKSIIESVMKGKDTLAVMPTGGGKSLCYQLPAVCLGGIVVVISPLISLMKDQVEHLKEIGIPAGAIFSGQSDEDKTAIFKEITEKKNYILFISPERAQKPGFATWIKSKKVTLFAIDEAHCVSQWGPDFREDYHRLSLLRELRPDVPVLALTATATPEVLRDVSRQLNLKKPDQHVYGFYRKNLYYQVAQCADAEEKTLYIIQALKQNPTGRVIVYCGTRKQTEELSSLIKVKFAKVGYYHAGLSPDARNLIQDQFSKGTLRILFATNAFGMGIDHPDVRLVIHFQMPANIESLYQEMGRAGRDGLDSTCILLYTKKDKGLHSYFINSSDAAPDVIRRRWTALEAITQFAEGGECRHSGILTYFKDTQRIKECGHCDMCLPHSLRGISAPEISEVRTKIKKSKSKNKVDLDSPLSRDEELRADVLKTWRKMYADANDVPAFVVFSNKTLRDLAIRNPKNLVDLEKVYGMGPHKVEHLGREILKTLESASESV